jgi:hypothetical protein
MEVPPLVNKVLLRYRGPDGSVETLEVVDRLSCQLAEASDFAMSNCREENDSTVIFLLILKPLRMRFTCLGYRLSSKTERRKLCRLKYL